MGTKRAKFICRAIEGQWQIYKTKTGRKWGNPFKQYPEELLDELNDSKRPEEVAKLNNKKE